MLIGSESGSPEQAFTLEVKYSPTVEMAASLNSLASGDANAPGHEWTSDVRSRFSPSELDEFKFLSNASAQWTLVMDLFCYLERSNITDMVRFLTDLKELDDVDFSFCMLSGLVSRKEIRELIFDPERIASWHDKDVEHWIGLEIAARILSNPAELKLRLAEFLLWYWDAAFSGIWEAIGVLEMDKVRSEQAILGGVDPEQYLEFCNERLHVSDGAVTIDRDGTKTYERSSFSFVDVFLSAFIGKAMMVNCIEGRLTVYKGFDLSASRKTVADEQLFGFIRAINGETKMRILSELRKEPKTTKELSDILGIAPSTVSVHLKMMRDAELIYPQRVQNAVYNRFLYENYQAFLAFLMGYFG